MESLAVVEIAADSQGCLPAAMLENLYRSSEKGIVILILRGTGFEAVDEVLDDVVASLPHSIPGVRYVDSGDGDEIARACGGASLIFWKTGGFRRQVAGLAGPKAKVLPVSRIEYALGCGPAEAGARGNGREARPAADRDRSVQPRAAGRVGDLLGSGAW